MQLLVNAVQMQMRLIYQDAIVLAAVSAEESAGLSSFSFMNTAIVCLVPSEHLAARVFYSDGELFTRLADPAVSSFSIAWELMVQIKDGGFDQATLREELPFLNLGALRTK